MRQVKQFFEKTKTRKYCLDTLAYPAIGQIKREGRDTPIASLDLLAQIFNAVPEDQRSEEFRRVHRGAVHSFLRELRK